MSWTSWWRGVWFAGARAMWTGARSCSPLPPQGAGSRSESSPRTLPRCVTRLERCLRGSRSRPPVCSAPSGSEPPSAGTPGGRRGRDLHQIRIPEPGRGVGLTRSRRRHMADRDHYYHRMTWPASPTSPRRARAGQEVLRLVRRRLRRRRALGAREVADRARRSRTRCSARTASTPTRKDALEKGSRPRADDRGGRTSPRRSAAARRSCTACRCATRPNELGM